MEGTPVRHPLRRRRRPLLAAALCLVVAMAGIGPAAARPSADRGGNSEAEPEAKAKAETESETKTKTKTKVKPKQKGTAAGQFRNPVNTGPDPALVTHEGHYYIATTQGDALRIWRSPSIATLLTAEPHEVWRDSDPSRNRQIWAPGLYKATVDGAEHWYLYYTASDGNDSAHRMYVLESEGSDPLGPYHFKAKVADSGNDRWAIDGEPFEHDGKLYFAWSGERDDGVRNQLFLAPMANPWTLGGSRVHLPVDGNCPEVREGPTPIRNKDGRLFLTYSACDTGKPDYAVWSKSLPPGANPLDPAAWTQEPGPLFSRNDAAGVWGPGHHFFFTSPDGTEDWIAYHAKNTSAYTYDWRTTRAQRIGWTADGRPDLGVPVALGTPVDLPAGDPGPGTTALNDTDPQVTYTGNWNSGSQCGAQCFHGDDHWSEEAGATATIRFNGTRLALLSVKDTGNGIAAVSVDGGAEQRVDFHGSTRVGEQLQWVSPRLEPGEHTVTVRVTGEKNPESGAAFVSVDRAEVYP
ncbi:hydrolase [Streptomyces armeniacus]|uniref:Hydrolase n=1 Tax=Streptomyces armeniacus TaxID=83291 RepID=A0A345XLH4_9ACTN|nr:family 43 glycosylhydrolase [Streptomyces armeniacus]AXK32490.1 hydrolase [Streptomyces armeniacus]